MTNTAVVKIGKKSIGFRFTMLTLQMFSDHTGVEFGDIIDHLKQKPIGSIVILFMAANTVYTEGKNGSVSKYTVDNWIMEMSQKDYQNVMNCWGYSMEQLVKKLLADTEEEEPKKK